MLAQSFLSPFVQPYLSGATTSGSTPVPPAPVILYEPMKTVLVNGVGSFRLADSDANVPMQVKVSDSNPAADWTTAPYALAQVDIALVKMGYGFDFSKASVVKNNCMRQAQADGVLITCVFTAGDITAMSGVRFIALVKFTFANGQIRAIQGPFVEKN